jgi:type IV pilus assembly protein PilO
VAFETGLEGKPWYVGVAIGLVVGGVLYFGAHRWLLQPKKDQLVSMETRLTDLRSRIQEGQTAQRQLPRFREEVRQLELQLDRLLRILPARRNTPDLLRRVRALAEQGDFDLLRFNPSQLVEQEFYSEYPISMNLEGEYHSLARFFEEVSRFPRIINVDNLSITSLDRDDSPHTLAASFDAKTFVYTDEVESDEDDEPEGGQP